MARQISNQDLVVGIVLLVLGVFVLFSEGLRLPGWIFGVVAIVLGALMLARKIGGGQAGGIALLVLGILLLVIGPLGAAVAQAVTIVVGVLLLVAGILKLMQRW